MAYEDNPVSRMKYGEELRRRRDEAGISQERLGELAIMSRSFIAHIEGGRRRPSAEDAQRLDQILSTGGFFERFLPTLDGRKVAEHFETALEMELLATIIREYASSLVPGFLQTEAYAKAVLSSGADPRSDEERDRLLVTRLDRGRILDSFYSPVVWLILSEAVLRHVIGGPTLMAEQLHRIGDLAERRRIRLHILPFSAGYHSLMEGPVKLMWFEDMPPVAYVEGLKTGKVWDFPSVVRDCQVSYDHALGDALSHRQSLAMIRSVAEEYEHAQQ
jgi:transcriptional regulator with XRE-family HTH domain